MFVQVIDVLDHPVLHGTGESDVVKDLEQNFVFLTTPGGEGMFSSWV